MAISVRARWLSALLALAVALSVVALVGRTTSASATAEPQSATITNFGPSGGQQAKLDVNGRSVDAHDGMLAYFGGTYYLYGTAYGCGYQLQTDGSPFCGFKSYSSTDLTTWQDNGYLFDGTTDVWQGRCAPPRYGCYRPHVLFNAATQSYVLWINGYDNASGYHVFSSVSPSGPFVEQAEPVLAFGGNAAGGYVNGDFSLFADTDGSAYIAYTFVNYPVRAWETGHVMKVQKLNASYTSGVGAAANLGTNNVEAPSLFRKDATYYLVYGPNCAYCGGTPTVYKTASSPMGPWSGESAINATSCGGQPSFVAQLPTDSAEDVYVFGSDLWDTPPGHPLNPNQALANFYWAPLTFTGPSIDPFACPPTAQIPLAPGLVPSGPPVVPGLDQTSGSADFAAVCDVSAARARSQAFVAGRAGILSGLELVVLARGGPSAPLRVDIHRAGSDATPTGPALFTETVAASSLNWSLTTVALSPGLAVAAGESYAVVVSTASGTGCYGTQVSAHNPYRARVDGSWVDVATERVRDGGGSWTTQPWHDLRFASQVTP